MNNIAQVEILSADYLDIYKWLRKEMPWMVRKEALELSRRNLIDFNGDYEKAIMLYNYLHNCLTNSARLIIDISYDTRYTISSFGVIA